MNNHKILAIIVLGSHKRGSFDSTFLSHTLYIKLPEESEPKSITLIRILKFLELID